MKLVFDKPLGRFRGALREGVIAAWLNGLGAAATGFFAERMRQGPHTGRIYIRDGGRVHQASAPYEYPAVDYGRLIKTVRHQAGAREVRIGTSMPYSRDLRLGAPRLLPRLMSDSALRTTLASYPRMTGWCKWRRL